MKKRKLSKKQLKKMEQARKEVQPKLAVKLTDDLEIWIDERNYILKDNKGVILGYFGNFLQLIWGLFSMKVKLSFNQEVELKDIVKRIDEAEKYIRGLVKKLEELQRLR